MASRQPTTWDEYERGDSPGRNDSVSSAGRHSVRFEEEALLSSSALDGHGDDVHERAARPRRRSSITNRLTALTDIGGVNSIRSFTRSWQRAAVFAEVLPQRPSFVFAPDQEPAHAVGGPSEPVTYGRSHIAQPEFRHSLLRRDLEGENLPENAISDEEEAGPAGAGAASSPDTTPGSQRDGEGKMLGGELGHAFGPGSHRSNSIFEVPPHLSSSPLIGSFGSHRTYGTVESGITRASMAEAAEMWRQQQEMGGEVPDGERPQIMVKEVEQDGKIVLAVSGQSTLPQTIVNSTK